MDPVCLWPCTRLYHVFLISFLISRASLNLVTQSDPCRFLVMLQHAVRGARSALAANTQDWDGITQIRQKFTNNFKHLLLYSAVWTLLFYFIVSSWQTAPKWEVILASIHFFSHYKFDHFSPAWRFIWQTFNEPIPFGRNSVWQLLNLCYMFFFTLDIIHRRVPN